jgi:hypothetical protein
VLGQYASEYYAALGAPLIAEVSLDKFVDGTVGVIEEVTHARFLGERVALGNAVRVGSPQHTPRASKVKIVSISQPRGKGRP